MAVRIDGVARHYEWGSTTAIPALLGIPPDGRPLAELWFGAHPGAPSPVDGGRTTLDRLVAADPEGVLGAACAARFERRLPFLLKILAAGQALSVQVHPTVEQARTGFAAEEAEGIPVDAPHRNYRDVNHKPELLCALTPFDAMCGFRTPEAIFEVLAQLGLRELDFLEAALAKPQPLREAFVAALSHESPEVPVGALAARVATVTEGPLLAVRLASEDHPGDRGVLLALLLNYLRLRPGEAIFLDAGNVHAYVRGMAVEIMANSDNVLRCGLTPKHVDVPELMRIADFAPLPEPRWRSVDGEFTVPVPDFTLNRCEVDGEMILRDAGPRIVLCTDGDVVVDGIATGPGRAVFVPAGSSSVIDGRGEVFVAGAAVA